MTKPNTIYCVDKVTGQQCPINANTPKRINNSFLEGDMMFLMRNDNEDQQQQQQQQQQQSYFKGKKRRFDLQFQFRLKQPTNTIWYGMELDDSLDLSTMQRMVAKAGLGFCQKMNPGSFYSRVSTEPCMTFRVDKSMDRVVRTPSSQIPPRLGQDAIEESSESIQKRARHGMVWNTEDTYTTSCFSSYFDFMSWSCMNMPCVPNFDATKIVGNQPLRFVCYTLNDEAEGHVASNKNYIFNLEISNPSKTRMGPAALAMQKCGVLRKTTTTTMDDSSITSVTTTSSLGDDSSIGSLDCELDDDCSDRSTMSTEVKVLMKGRF